MAEVLTAPAQASPELIAEIENILEGLSTQPAEGELVGVAPLPLPNMQIQEVGSALGIVAGGGSMSFQDSLPDRRRHLHSVTHGVNSAEVQTTTQEVVPDEQLATVHYIGNTATEAATQTTAPEVTPIDDNGRLLTEVDHLIRYRLPDGTYPEWVYKAVRINQVTGVKEAVIPHAVSKTFQVYVLTGEYDEYGEPIGVYMWLDKTDLEVAESGYLFHRKPEAHQRVAIEVDEAKHNNLTMREGYAKILISPRDERLKDEHLGLDDAIRISYRGTNNEGEKGKFMESILVKYVPLEAWEAMLKDSNNLWGKSIPLEQSNSPLAVMKTHRELEIPLDRLPEGVVSLVAAVVQYIKDPEMKSRVEQQLILLRGDQQEIDQQAVSVAERWMQFEAALADSLHQGRATHDVEMFIDQLQNEWGDEDIVLFKEHRTPDGGLRMENDEPGRKLAARLERAKRNLLWTAAAVVAGNSEVLKQMDKETARQIYDREVQIQQMIATNANPQQIRMLEVQNNRAIAQQNVTAGGGCPGEVSGGFKKQRDMGPARVETDIQDDSEEDRSNWELSKGPCRIESCPNHKKVVTVGPCGVCMDRCQRIYDKGGDPTKLGKKSSYTKAA